MTQNQQDTPDSTPEPKGDSESASGAEEKESQGQKKERVLHTRVPAVLEQELKRLAESLRMPVSNVVRAILEDAVTAVDRVGRRAEGEVHRAVDRITEQRERLHKVARSSSFTARDDASAKASESSGEKTEEAPDSESPSSAADPFEGVIGFQRLVLAKEATCARCGRVMEKGSEAFLAVGSAPAATVLIGNECLPIEYQP